MRSFTTCVAAAFPALMLAAAAAGAQPSGPATGPQGTASGSAAQESVLFAITYRPGPLWRSGQPFIEQVNIREHYAYIRGLFEEGRVFAAGGLGQENGLVLFYARSQEEADAILAADPMVVAGSFAGEARPYRPSFISDGQLTRTRE